MPNPYENLIISRFTEQIWVQPRFIFSEVLQLNMHDIVMNINAQVTKGDLRQFYHQKCFNNSNKSLSYSAGVVYILIAPFELAP